MIILDHTFVAYLVQRHQMATCPLPAPDAFRANQTNSPITPELTPAIAQVKGIAKLPVFATNALENVSYIAT